MVNEFLKANYNANIYAYMQIIWVRKSILSYFQEFERVKSKCLSMIMVCILL